jgi:2,4-dienoyl-CoA reductase-like NADH-dependent reductase (Old Yellow Enzyme family)
LNEKKIGFVEYMESSNVKHNVSKLHIASGDQIPDICAAVRPHFKGLIIGNYGFDDKTGIEKIRSGNADLISFGRNYISHPDLA